jgi:hypothetical protein
VVGGWLDSNWFRVAGYLAAAGVTVLAGCREVRSARAKPRVWPTFWFLNGGLLLMAAIGLTGDLGHWIADLGRHIAVSEGWYAERRKPQTVAVASVAAIWLGSVVVALRRAPGRWRRYLPTAIAVFTLLCFAGIRLISLHQVDSLLYHRDLAGVQVDAVLELAGLLVAIVVTVRQLRLLSRRNPSTEPSVRATDQASRSV